MANRDDNRDQSWGQRGRHGQHDRWEPDNERHRSQHDRPWEQRSFGQEGGHESEWDRNATRHGPGSRGRRAEGGEPWHGEARYGARYDQDRVGYGGQEYGMEGGRQHRQDNQGQDAQDRGRDRGRGRDERETWRAEGGPYGDLELNPRNRGVQEFGPPSDYAYHPPAGHEFDPDYVHWREEQMRSHDRDYHDWRHAQQQSYDDDYRRFRSERREHFGRTFQDWRNQRSAVGGVADTSVAPGVSGYGAKVGMPSGYDANQSSKPSGMLDPSGGGASSSSGGSGSSGASGGTGDTSPEFGKAPPQVQAASEGWDTRGAAEDRVADKSRDQNADKSADDTKKR